MKTRSATLGFAIFVVASVLATYTIWSTLQRSVPGDTRQYSAVFNDVLGLRVGDDVRVAGVRVGRVDEIGFDPARKARVVLRVRAKQELHTTTRALIRYQNLIGQRYVELAVGTGDARPLTSGATIPLERTESSFDVSTLLAGFEPLFSVLQPEQVNSLSQTLVQALQGDGVSLSALITQSAGLASTFQQRDQILGEVITNLSSVISGLANRSGDLETLIAQSNALVSGLYEQGETLKTAVTQAATSTTALTDLILQVRPGIARAQQSATSGVNLLLSNGARLDQAALELPFVLAGLARISGDGAYINSYICSLDVSLWAVLFPPGLVSQIGGNSHSEVCR